MKVLVATSVHPDFDSRIVKQSDTLAAAGFDVVLLAPWLGTDGPARSYTPRFFERARGLRGRIKAYGRFLWNSIFSRFDAIHIHDFDLLPFATIVRLLTWRLVIYDVHENYAEEARLRSWIPRPVRWPLSHLVALVERICCLVVRREVVVVPIQERRFGSWGCDLVMVKNFCAISLAPSAPNDLSIIRPEHFVFNSSGQVESYGSLVYLESSRLLRASNQRIPLAAIDRFEGDHDIEARIRKTMESDAPDFRLLPRVRPHELAGYLGNSAIGVSSMLDAANRRIGIPTKLFEYMAFGIPIVATDVGYQGEIMRDSKAGILVPPGDAAALAEAIARLWNDPELRRSYGAAGRAAFFDRYCWEKEGEKLVAYYKRLKKGV